MSVLKDLERVREVLERVYGSDLGMGKDLSERCERIGEVLRWATRLNSVYFLEPPLRDFLVDDTYTQDPISPVGPRE